MAVVKKRRWCKDCDRYTMHEKEVFSGAAGCILTVLTCGLFLPLWGFVMLGNWTKPVLCSQCGRKRR